MSEEYYLLTNHRAELLEILECQDKDKYFSINISFSDLLDLDTTLGNGILTTPEESIKQWNKAALNAQSEIAKENNNYITKTKVNCRIYNLPPWPHVSRYIFPGNEDANKFLQLNGVVVRMAARKLLVFQRNYVCSKCKYQIIVEAQCDKRYIIKKPKECTNPEGCKGKNFIDFEELDRDNYKDFQEIRIQEDLSKVDAGTAPGHMLVVLEDDLVNSCKPGENVTITGILTRRWSEFDKGAKITVDVILKALHVQVNTCSGLIMAETAEMKQYFEDFWKKYENEPLVGRSIILNSIAPEIHGNALIKLSTAVVLAGGSQNEDNMSTGVTTRSECHLLFVGDPGTGKSQMLRFASKIMPRAILTTGVGTTAAGLTVTAVMDNGDWQLEAGALVMADGGICCIDEFNSMREHDRTSIHEAMEQQTISVAKAGIVCKLKTRCSILAACNPKSNRQPSQPLAVNVAMSSALLSRFDIILLVKDAVEENGDRKIAQHLLKERLDPDKDKNVWDLEILQAYYASIRKQNPKLTNEAEVILRRYYQLQRRCKNINRSRTTIRLLESLIRLSQGHAKLMFHSEVQVMDATYAVIITDTSMNSEFSLLHLRVDFETFLDNPERQYYDLSEDVLGKLNLDYIFQMEANLLNRRGNFGNAATEDDNPSNRNMSSSHKKQSHFSQPSTSHEETEILPSTSTGKETFCGMFSQKSISRSSSSSQELPGKEINYTKDSENDSDIMKSSNSASIKNNDGSEKPSTSTDKECSDRSNNFNKEKPEIGPSQAKNESNKIEISKKKPPTNVPKIVRSKSQIDFDELFNECLENTAETKMEVKKGKKKRPLNPSSKPSKKLAKCNDEDEKEIIKQLPSINDDFAVFDKHINWDLEETSHEKATGEADIMMRDTECSQGMKNFAFEPKEAENKTNKTEISNKKPLRVSEIVKSRSQMDFDEMLDECIENINVSE
ncbi:unnamed protein product [Ceutorhynchus assimilis]|uniref:DNA helicase MCM9 n=1 Tax=Ceutorhynchus assimilis TaxID=467358 RepID=A0A9N9ME32_9CUCU|nr:unnamed protein product [Ceutorhynchus assimilis]